MIATEKQQHCGNSQSPRICSKFGFFSNPSTPRLQSQQVSSPSLRCRTTTLTPTPTPTIPTSSLPNSPKLQCKTTTTAAATTNTTPKKSNSPRLFHFSNPSSPRSPSSFSLLKASLRLSKHQNRCAICLQSVKAGQGTAIFTAECSHSFHFPCVAAHAAKQHPLACPVCGSSWKLEAPLLSLHHNHNSNPKSKSESEFKLREVKTKTLRVYNDDEPLVSPISLAQFNPIPESEENDDEECQENHEFQGFFVNASPLSNQSLTDPIPSVDVMLLPEAAVLAVGRSYESYTVMLRVRAPPSKAAHGARRAPVDLVTVLDVSGSMNGQKQQMMKRAMRSVISSLRETDRLSIVAFSGSSKRLLPLRRMTTDGRRSARRIVDALGGAGQGMSVNDALKKAAKVIEDRRQRNPVATIIVLTDGQNDRPHNKHSNQMRSSPFVSTTRISPLEIPVHAIDLGHAGACYQPLSENAFSQCIRGLLSVVVQDLNLKLGFVSGSAPADIASVYSLTGRPASLGSGSIRLGDLYAEEERELLLELRVPAPSAGSHHVLSVRFSYMDPSSQELICSKEHALVVPRPQAVRSSSPTIARLRNLHISTRAIAESRRLIERNDFSGAHHQLSSARALLIQSRSTTTTADDNIRSIEAELHRLDQQQHRNRNGGGRTEEKAEPLTPTSAWKAAERLAKVAIMRKHMNRVSDLHGFENARF